MKRSVTNSILFQVAMGLESERGARLDYYVPDKIIPDIKTIPAYESALDKAVYEFFLYGSDDDIFMILKDAKESGAIPREYKSLDVRNFESNGVPIQKANLGYNAKGKVNIKIHFTFGSVKIVADKVEISGRPKLSSNLCKIIEACQDSITRIQRILK